MNADELAAALTEAVRAGLESAQQRPAKLMFDLDEAAELTGLPRSWLKREAECGRIPSRKVGHYRKFSYPDLEAIVAAHEVKPTSGPMAQRGQRRLRSVP